MTPKAPPAEPLLDEPTRRLCAAIADGSTAPPRLAIVAPGGYGKTAVLDHLAERRARAGLPVFRFRPGEPAPDGALVLVDDAHELAGAALAEVATLAADERTGLVVAARPRPRPPALTSLLGALAGQIVLRPLDRAAVGAVLGSAGQAAFVHGQTGGVPGFVHRVAAALGSGDTEPRLPEAALAGFRHELDTAEPDVLGVLLAAETGARLDADLLAGLLDRPAGQVGEAVEAARATGLLGPDGTLLPIAAAAIAALVPADRRAEVCGRLAALSLARGAPVLALARRLLELGPGIGGSGAAEVFETAGDEATSADPVLAGRLFDAAVAAGLPGTAIGARRAEVAARAGDLDTALRLADEVVASDSAPGRARGALVAGTALAYRGQLDRATTMFRWSGGALGTGLAAIGLLGTGRLDEAGQSLAAPGDGEPPTLLAGAMADTARGLLDSVSGPAATALSTVVSAAEMLEPVGRAALLPDSPAALGAILAIHAGEPAAGEALLERAIAAGTGGPVLAARHRLLLAWISMVRGELDQAAGRLEQAGTELAPRDWLFAVALRVGIARRASDVPGLHRIWGQACEAVIRHQVDLFTLLPFGEFAVAAARLGDRDRLAPHLLRAAGLCRSLGEPPLWSAHVHWTGLHAAITAEQPEEAAAHAKALPAEGPYQAALADAAACWLDVIGGRVDPQRVERAARRLGEAGLRWDAARLAGQAAIRTPDRRAMVALLEVARALQGRAAAPEPTAEPARLSERERQVAELVVAGLTYKQVGDRLFISAKTVEHHVARMRQRLGAGSRGELLARLRSLVN